jgi:hypothetical protein
VAAGEFIGWPVADVAGRSSEFPAGSRSGTALGL